MRIGITLCFAISAFVLTLTQTPARAETTKSCGGSYVVKPGDTLSEISQKLYGAAKEWRKLFDANRSRIGGNARLILVGQYLKVPCLPGTRKTALSTAEPARQADSSDSAGSDAILKIDLLTADDYRPFTDRSLPSGGMITEIVNTALKASGNEGDRTSHKISWVNDWSAHLSPLLVNNAFDMGFPWFKPECDRYAELDRPAQFRCDTFYFSAPVFEIVVRFFARKDGSFEFTSDAAVEGKRICRPAGYFTFDLDKDGRNWVKAEKITLLRPQSVEDCFRLLERREIDAIALNEFTGYEAITKLGMTDTIRAIPEPVSLLNLHVVIPKKHKRAQIYIDYINRSLGHLRETGEYDRIVDRHLSEFWKNKKLDQDETPGSG